jgi:hypothetical protein
MVLLIGLFGALPVDVAETIHGGCLPAHRSTALARCVMRIVAAPAIARTAR